MNALDRSTKFRTARRHAYQPKPLKVRQNVGGISAKSLEIHHDELYEGYVKKANEIQSRLESIVKEVTEDQAKGNSTYSELRCLKENETYAVNGVYLHEWYFDGLRGDGRAAVSEKPDEELAFAIAAQFNSTEDFTHFFSECAMSARGWTVLAWDIKAHRLAIYNCDTHNQGGVWGAIPIIVLDVYEHAYFMDFAADRAAYIETFWKHFDWEAANTLYSRARLVRV